MNYQSGHRESITNTPMSTTIKQALERAYAVLGDDTTWQDADGNPVDTSIIPVALAELSAPREEEKSDTAHIEGWRLDPQPDRFSKEEGWVYVINGPNGEFLTVSSDCQTYSGALVDPRFAIVQRMVYAMNAATYLSGQSAKVEGRYTQRGEVKVVSGSVHSATVRELEGAAQWDPLLYLNPEDVDMDEDHFFTMYIFPKAGPRQKIYTQQEVEAMLKEIRKAGCYTEFQNGETKVAVPMVSIESIAAKHGLNTDTHG